ncbi:uncharacterized protein LOC123907615 [Trifolium pratense]|uniref:uncharacterized protein LOC123907615 n=1 Tax=Trifolium pratense TaxID=57577 RepID=UPI001E692FAC|nr:uncharacterized protein LOC123907615 [Trifolium pratense]
MMQRLIPKLRHLAVQSRQTLQPLPSSRRFLHHSLPQPLHSASTTFTSRSLFNLSSFPFHASRSSQFSPSLIQIRHVSARDRSSKRKPVTPVKSKVKKTKIKSYSSYKSRFRLMSDGSFRRWREGKRHNAHLKSKIAKRRLRQPALVPVAYAKVMKKLGFCG